MLYNYTMLEVMIIAHKTKTKDILFYKDEEQTFRISDCTLHYLSFLKQGVSASWESFTLFGRVVGLEAVTMRPQVCVCYR